MKRKLMKSDILEMNKIPDNCLDCTYLTEHFRVTFLVPYCSLLKQTIQSNPICSMSDWIREVIDGY